ncbi:membrane protein [Microbacterium phage Cece]|nr:membrane protein [Microbacterium phage Cece]
MAVSGRHLVRNTLIGFLVAVFLVLGLYAVGRGAQACWDADGVLIAGKQNVCLTPDGPKYPWELEY